MSTTADEKISKLETTVADLQRRLLIQEAKTDIRTLHHIYGHYLDRCLYQEVTQLFADDCEVRFHGGIWKGPEGVKRLYLERFQKTFTGGKNGPVYGFLLDHPQHQDVISVDESLLTGKARFRCTMQAGRHISSLPKDADGKADVIPRQWWEGGLYENKYERASLDAPWKIKVLDYHPLWHGTFEEGWSKVPSPFVPFPSVLYPEDPAGPDALQEKMWLFPDTDVVPFHYNHPITGKQVKPDDLVAIKMF